MNMDLVSPFMIGGTRTPYKLINQHLLIAGFLSVYDLLLPSGMKVLKGKTIQK